MDEAPGIRFRPTAAQRRLLEGGKLHLQGGRSGGRRHATEMFIVTTAANPEQARLALEDLHTRGIALLDGEGNRVEPGGRRRFAAVKFDEERK